MRGRERRAIEMAAETFRGDGCWMVAEKGTGHLLCKDLEFRPVWFETDHPAQVAEKGYLKFETREDAQAALRAARVHQQEAVVTEKDQELAALREQIADLRRYLESGKFQCGDPIDGYVHVKDVLARLP
ncbi:MAG: hypothetical protein KGR26_16280 [Cyanobacteria bacterium REEB65]|nr:hypothetical protein [Cyanobacteria bacterium REEB65]